MPIEGYPRHEGESVRHPWVSHIIEVARGQYIEHSLQLSAIARELDASPDYIGKLFLRDTGCSFRNYVLTLRMRTAARLLGDGKSVKEAAALSGYCDLGNFNRDFRKIFGRAPRKWEDDSRRSVERLPLVKLRQPR
jgi:AraC-like DNA-binding protein